MYIRANICIYEIAKLQHRLTNHYDNLCYCFHEIGVVMIELLITGKRGETTSTEATSDLIN